jgi:hypothetical protein
MSAETCAACDNPTPQDIDAPLCRMHFNRAIAWALNPEIADEDMPYPSCHLIEDER